MGIIKQGNTLKFARRPSRFGGVVSTSVQCSSFPVCRSDEFAAERSHWNGFPNSEQVRLLHPLLPHPQVGWWSKTHLRSQTSESCPYETAVQDNYIESNPLANMLRGLVLFAGSERCLLSHPDSPPQAVLEIRLRGSGLSIHGPSLWVVPGSPHFYEVHVCGSFPAETAGNPHPELPWRLAHFGPVWGRASISQIRAPQPLRVPRTQGQLCQERASQRISFLGTVIDLARMRAVVTPEGALAINSSQLHSNSESLDLSKHFRGFWASWPLRLRYFSWACFTCSPFSTAWNLEFLYTLGYTDTLRCSSGPLEEQSVDRTWRVPGHGLQK